MDEVPENSASKHKTPLRNGPRFQLSLEKRGILFCTLPEKKKKKKKIKGCRLTNPSEMNLVTLIGKFIPWEGGDLGKSAKY